MEAQTASVGSCKTIANPNSVLLKTVEVSSEQRTLDLANVALALVGFPVAPPVEVEDFQKVEDFQ